MAAVYLFLLSLMVLCFAVYVFENETNMMKFKLEFMQKSKELNKATDNMMQFKLEFMEKSKELNKATDNMMQFKLEFMEKSKELNKATDNMMQFKLEFMEKSKELNKATDNMMQFKLEFMEKIKELNKTVDLIREGSGSAGQHAFYAYMSRDEPEPGGHHIFVYDVAETNVGNSYNSFTGIFTVPQDGLYSFTWSTRVECNLAHTTELVLNMRILGSTYVYCGYNTVTGHVITRASKGDAVFVRTHGTSPGKGAVKSNTFGRSAFSGFFIG